MATETLTVYTSPIERPGAELSLPYQKIWGMSYLGRQVGRISFPSEINEQMTERQLELPKGMSRRLLKVASLAEIELRYPAYPEEYKFINCHFFSRYIAGMVPSLEHPFTVAEGQRVEGNLGLGEIGIVSAADDIPYHSLIGLGEDNPESIQEMWGTGLTGLCNNQDLINYLLSISEDHVKDIALYRQAQSS